MKKKVYEHERAHDLRSLGYSYKDISKTLNISKSSAYLYASHIKITEDQQQELQNRVGQNFRGVPLSKERKQQNREFNIKYGIYPQKYGVDGNSIHRKIERYALPFIESRFDTNGLVPEKINGHWFDFCNSEYIIEYTIDVTHGITSAINRFQVIINDPRKKILITRDKYFGKVRKNRLYQTGAIFVNIWFDEYSNR